MNDLDLDLLVVGFVLRCPQLLMLVISLLSIPFNEVPNYPCKWAEGNNGLQSGKPDDDESLYQIQIGPRPLNNLINLLYFPFPQFTNNL